jgi:tetratricopeptide (TPR) repeat protein
MARLHRAQRKLVEAESWVRKAIALKPDFAPAHYELGLLFPQSEALPHYERALELDPEFVEARWAVAMAQSDLAPREGETSDDAAARFGAR